MQGSLISEYSAGEKRLPIQDAFRAYMKDPEMNADKLIEKLQNLKDLWCQERDKANQRIWRNNVMFYSGNHYVRDVSNAGSQYRVKLRENHVNNIINRMLSILVQNMPIVRVFPSSDSSQDLQDAENTEMYGKFWWRTKKFEKQLMKFVKYSLIFGNAFIYRQWNPDLGGKIVLGAEDTDSGEREISEYRGDIETFIDDPFKIAVRPGIEDFDDMYDVIRSIPVSRSMIEQKYGSIEADPVTTYNSFTGELRQDEDSAMMNTYFHKPTPWFQEGCMIQWAGKKLLKGRPATQSEKELPVTHLPFDKVPMKFWGQASIEQVIDLQEQLNRAASMIVEARNLCARPRVLASNEAKMPAQAITDRPGDIWRYAVAGGKPEIIVPSFNFQELAAHKADVRNALQMVSGITSASRGDIPAATRTALALQLVLEQDRSQYLPFIKSMNQCILDHMGGLFAMAAENISEDDPRTIKIEGHNHGTRTFHGGMVPSELDLYLEDTNPLGWTAGSRIENTMELAKIGAIKDRNELLEMLKLHNPDVVFKIETINRQTQQKENQDLNKGQNVEIGPEDLDVLHLEELVKVMATYEYKSKAPAVKAAYENHASAHKKRIQDIQKAAASPPQAGVPGAPGAPVSKSAGIQPGSPMSNEKGRITAGGIKLPDPGSRLAAPNPAAEMERLLASSRG